MAVIMRMRKHGNLLIVVIGVAIVSFLLMDALNSQTGLFRSGSENQIGEVNGTKLSYEEFDAKNKDVQKRYLYFQGFWQNPEFQWTDEQRFELRNYAWDELVEDNIVQKEYDKVGIKVPVEELESRILTPNPIDAVRNFYTQVVDNTPNAIYDVEKMRQVINEIRQITPDDQRYVIKDFYIQLEKLLEIDLQKSKYLNLLVKSTYVPNWKAESDFRQKNNTSDIKFLALEYSTIPDEEVEPSDEELESFYNKNKKKYTPKPTRNIEYVIFDILPTAADSAASFAYITDKFERLQNAKNDSAFFRQYAESKVLPGYYAKEALVSSIVDTFFKADTGTIFGPYLDNGKYIISKLYDRQKMADSVKVRHIFTSLQNYGTYDSAHAIIDSAMGRLNLGVPFDSVAARYSDDKGSGAQGGDLGWIVPSANLLRSFYDAIFIEHTEGDLFVVKTSVGFHIVQITDTAGYSTKVHVGFLDKTIRPGTVTRDSIFNVASKFYTQYNTADSFDTGIRREGLTKRFGEDFTGNELYITGVNVPARNVLKWVFESPLNSITMFREFEGIDNKYVVARITKINDKENITWESFKDDLKTQVIKEKKATLLTDKIIAASAGTKDLNQIASKLNVDVKTASSIGFAIQYVEGLGVEPLVAAVANALAANTISEPIKGNNAVILVETTNKIEAELPADWTISKLQIKNSLQSKFGYNILEQVRNNAEITDLRYKYF